MSRRNLNEWTTVRIFSPRTIKKLTTPAKSIFEANLASISGSGYVSMSPTGSSEIDPTSSPLKNTQQLPIDFSKFENHTFFSSAEANVNIAFEKIINDFPFDGAKTEYDDFIDNLTGFEKHVLKNYPSHTGYLTFDAAQEQHISVIDKEGALFPNLSRNVSGRSILSPRKKSMTLEAHIAIASSVNIGDNVIFQLFNEASNVGFSVFSNATNSASPTATINFALMSGSQILSASVEVGKDKFNNLAFVYDTAPTERRALIYSGSSLLAYSKQRILFKNLQAEGSNFTIASGSSFRLGGADAPTFTPAQTFSGSINELRLFSKARTKEELSFYSERPLHATDDLTLYYKFNEPTGSFTNNSIVLDHAGSSLHGTITNFSPYMRSAITGSTRESSLMYEEEIFNPILFPSYPSVIDYNSNLLTSASSYDMNNPNLITKLIPSYLLDMAAAYGEINDDPNGSLMDGINPASAKTDFPGGASLGQPQIISALLFVWGREFDNLKMYLDHVSNLVFCDYDKEKSAADTFLPFVADYYGFSLPNFFANTSDSQFKRGSNIKNVGMSKRTLQQVKNKLWRRILTNMRDMVLSKGTQYSIRSMLRSAGFDANRYLRFIEYGGTVRGLLGEAREVVTEDGKMLAFSGSFDPYDGTNDTYGFSPSNPYLVTTHLSASRVEPGWPFPKGTFLSASNSSPIYGTSVSSDGLLTSGSWTIESRCLISRPLVNNRQSIFRLQTVGTGSSQALLLNLVANKQEKKVTLYYRPVWEDNAPHLVLPLTGVNVFDGDVWSLSVGRIRGDDIVDSRKESEIFLRAGRQVDGNLFEFHVTSSVFNEGNNISKNMLQNLDAGVNDSGSFIVIGSQSLSDVGLGKRFLNALSVVTASSARWSLFEGRSSCIRFWSKAMTLEESREHARNFKSLGVENPSVNFGFINNVSGSFEKLRLDISMDQPITASTSSGRLDLVDFSQTFIPNSRSGTSALSGAMAASFQGNTAILQPQVFRHSIISPHFDEAPAQNKVRIVGMDHPHLSNEFARYHGDGYQIYKEDRTVEDNRFGIEFSMMRALNEDMIRIFATLDYLDDAIGAPELKFATEYRGLVKLRNIYFNRLSETMNYSSLFEYFRFLDDAYDDLIELLIPRQTDYLGLNFIMESHILERFKYCYKYGDVYLGENDRRNLKGQYLLRQLVGDLGRFI